MNSRCTDFRSSYLLCILTPGCFISFRLYSQFCIYFVRLFTCITKQWQIRRRSGNPYDREARKGVRQCGHSKPSETPRSAAVSYASELFSWLVSVELQSDYGVLFTEQQQSYLNSWASGLVSDGTATVEAVEI